MKFQQHYDISNERIRTRWFPEQPSLFDTDYSSYPEQERSFLDEKAMFSLFVDTFLGIQTGLPSAFP